MEKEENENGGISIEMLVAQLNENKDCKIRGLLDAMDTYSLKEGFIITEDQDDEMMVGNFKIIIRPLWKWLLDF